jgi:hypothetical protein
MNLGASLNELAQRTVEADQRSDYARQAISAFRSSLTTLTPANAFRDWACAEVDLAYSFVLLGVAEGGVERMEEAVEVTATGV